MIFTYVSTQGEVDTTNLILQALQDNKTIAVPKCTGKGIMKAYQIQSMKDLQPGSYGIPEPKAGCREIGPQILELAIIPCVTCNEKGVRLGYGGGYYDRYLPTSPAIRILLCREKIMTADIPEEPHDCRADFIITEQRVILHARKICCAV